MNAIAVLRDNIQWGNQILEMVMADVTPEMAHMHPPGIANPIGALYVHAVCGQDAAVGVILKGGAPIYASSWAGKTGISQPEWQMSSDWARSVELDLPAVREYAQAVYKSAEDYLDSISEDDLDRVLDLTGVGLGHQTVGWFLNAIIAGHVNNMAGEISALKGTQGHKGYPF